MATSRYTPADRGRQMASPRPKTRDSKDTLCRNVLIYGHCRYEDQGCAFNHDQNKTPSNSIENVKKSFNADSPSFTPSQPGQLKKTTFSSQAVNATEFTPKTSSTGTLMPPDTNNSVFNPAGMEFTPQSQQNYGFNQAIATNGAGAEGVGSYNPFNMSSMGAALGAPYNPYGDDHNPLAGPSSYNYSASSGYSLQPLQHHMYYPIGQARPDLLPYQRQAHSFFMKEELREDLQKKSEDVRLVVPNSNLPSVMDGLYHSLVALDTSRNTGHNTFGNTVSWVFKAMSQGTGIPICLRRLQGFRVNNPQSLTPIEKWKRINNANVVSFLACFTSRDFGDSSLIFIHSYHPLSKTLSQYHFTSPKYSNHRYASQSSSRTQTQVPENVLWSYICQICNALKAIHGEGLAARCIDLTKVILTDKNRIRLAACGIHDVLDHEQLQQPRPMQDLQQEDFVQLGKLILSIGTSTNVSNNNMQMAMEQFSRAYSVELRQRVMWLLSPSPKKVDELAREISGHILDSFDASCHVSDDLYSELHKEVENGRVARLMMKLGCINERPEYENDVNWAETGERYQLKLFRDYVFHQVDSNGHPVIDLGHILGCLNKLDCGIDDKVYLTSRDNQSLFVVSYKELKKQLLNAFDDLRKAGKQSQPTPPRGY